MLDGLVMVCFDLTLFVVGCLFCGCFDVLFCVLFDVVGASFGWV